MAGGGKQTPRQRMINMMYLVLTAMLALQVSSSIIDKFIFLNQSLQNALEEQKAASAAALVAFKKEIEKQGNSSEGLARIKKAEALKAKTAEMIKYIDNLKKEIIMGPGGGEDKEHGGVKDAKEETKLEVMMIGGNKNGKGYELKKKLDAFREELLRDYKDIGITKDDLPELTPGNEKNPIYKHDPVQKGKDFVEANFGQTPVVAGLAILTQKQSVILDFEQRILKKLGAGDFSRELKFDKIQAVASADANVVAVGSEYKAEMFLVASASKAGPRMTVSTGTVTVDKDGKGEVKFNASGKGKQKWTGRITISQRGKDTTFVVEKEYEVVEAALIVKAEANFPLYRNCANPLQTAVPALGANYKPSFSVTNGSAVPGAKVGDVTIFPGAGPKAVLTVMSSGRKVGEAEFRVNPVPPPMVFIGNASNGPINLKDPLPMLPTIRMVAKSDETFLNTLPKEANFQVSQFTVRQFRGGRAIANNVVNGNTYSTSALSTRPGDGIQVEVTQVTRINSRGERESCPITAPIHSFFVR
jgi:gliding motility-associated protein GldM